MKPQNLISITFYGVLIALFTHPNFALPQNTITPQEIDSNLYLFSRNYSFQFSLSPRDLLETPYSPQYETQLLKFLQQSPNNLDTLLTLYEVQGYLHKLNEQKNTLARYKTTLDKKLNQAPKDLSTLLYASEYYRLQKDPFIQQNYLDSALKYYPNELKVKEFYMNFYLQTKKLEQAQSLAHQILQLQPQHQQALFVWVTTHYYDNISYGILNDFSYLEPFLYKNPENKLLPILKLYLQTIQFILQLTDFGLGELSFEEWRLPSTFKTTSDSLYQAWQNTLPSLPNPAIGHSMLTLIKIIEKDTTAAKTQFQQATQIDPFYLPAYYNYFYFHLELQNYNECIRTIQQLLKWVPNETHYLMLAKAYFLHQNYYRTESILNELLQKKYRTNEPHLHVAWAQYYLKLRKLNEAKPFLEAAANIDPRDPDYNFTAAIYHILTHNPRQAKHHLLNYLEFYPQDATAVKWFKSLP